MLRSYILLPLSLVMTLCLVSEGLPQTTLTATTGTPTLDGVISVGEWTSIPLVTANDVTLYAMGDGDFLYLAATWEDATESIQKNEWEFDGAFWAQSGDEDRLAFIWDMGLNGNDGASCATMCHGTLMHTTIGFVDVWHWKSARGNAMGFADDKYWDTVDRQSDPGTSTYQDNDEMGSGFPSYMGSSDPGANCDFLATDAAAFNAFDPYGTVSTQVVEEATNFDSMAVFDGGNVIPGYRLRIPEGDRASVHTAGKYESGYWTVEFKRAYEGSDYDFTVVPGSFVEFTHEIFDNEGDNHALNGFDPIVYTLDFDLLTGVVEPVAEVPAVYSLSQNYPNPFNPSTMIDYTIPRSSHVRLEMFNGLGELVGTLRNGLEDAGYHSVTFDAAGLPSGLYFYRLQSGDFVETKKLLLLK